MTTWIWRFCHYCSINKLNKNEEQTNGGGGYACFLLTPKYAGQRICVKNLVLSGEKRDILSQGFTILPHRAALSVAWWHTFELPTVVFMEYTDMCKHTMRTMRWYWRDLRLNLKRFKANIKKKPEISGLQITLKTATLENNYDNPLISQDIKWYFLKNQTFLILFDWLGDFIPWTPCTLTSQFLPGLFPSPLGQKDTPICVVHKLTGTWSNSQWPAP